jgi:N-acetylneuraminic acid mutarotase
VAVFGNLIYLLGGCDADQVCIKGSGDMPGYCQCESSTDTVYVFDTATETYSTAPQMPIPRYRHDACAVGTKLWLFGGRTMPDASSGYDSIITQVDTFDTVTGEWTANVATYPGDLGSDNSCSTLNGAIYLAGGYSNAYDVSYDTTYRFDPGNSTFTRLNGRMLQGRGDFSSSAAPGGVLRVWGGYSNASSDLASSWACLPLATSEVYDPVADAWSAGPPLPMPLAEKDDGIEINGTIYSVGGETKKRPVGCDYHDLLAVSDVFALNASATAWGRVTPLPKPRMRSTSAGVNGTIYLFGGQNVFINGSTMDFYPLAYTAYAIVVSATPSASAPPSASPSPSPSQRASPSVSPSVAASPASVSRSASPSASPLRTSPSPSPGSSSASPSVSPSPVSPSLSPSVSQSPSRRPAAPSPTVTATPVPATAAVLTLPVSLPLPAGVTAATLCSTPAVGSAVAQDVSSGIGGTAGGASAVFVANCTAQAAGGSRRRLLAAAGPRALQAAAAVFSVSAVVAAGGSAQAVYNALAALTPASFATTPAAASAATAGSVPASAFVATPLVAAIAAACGGGGASSCGALPTGPTAPGAAAPATNTGAIIGGVLGAAAAIAIAAGAFFVIRRRQAARALTSPRKGRKAAADGDDGDDGDATFSSAAPKRKGAAGASRSGIERKDSLTGERVGDVDAAPIRIVSPAVRTQSQAAARKAPAWQ